MCAPDSLELGAGARIDDGVTLGYPSGRAGVAPTLRIGPGAVLRQGTILYAGSSLGAHLETGHHVTVREQIEAGDELRIWNCTTVDYGCRIGNRVKLHANVYVAQFTVIEDDVFLAPGVTIANDLHPGREYSKQKMRGPRIGRGAQIGVNATILPYLEIGAGSMVGSGSVVTRDVPQGMLVYGNPARIHRRVEDLAEADLHRFGLAKAD